MSFVWKRLQRVNKCAVKYRILFELNELVIEGCSKWQPNKLIVVFTRRSRRRCSQPKLWEPTIRNPYLGLCKWDLPEIIDIEVTLFKDSQGRFESKEWTISIEDISNIDKRQRRIATGTINISDYIDDDDQFSVPSKHEFLRKKLKFTSKKVRRSYISFAMSTQFLKKGKATDDDMQSLASLISMNGPEQTLDLDDDFDQPTQQQQQQQKSFEYSDETQNEIYDMIEKFNQFLNNNNNINGNNNNDNNNNNNNNNEKNETNKNIQQQQQQNDIKNEKIIQNGIIIKNNDDQDDNIDNNEQQQQQEQNNFNENNNEIIKDDELPHEQKHNTPPTFLDENFENIDEVDSSNDKSCDSESLKIQQQSTTLNTNEQNSTINSFESSYFDEKIVDSAKLSINDDYPELNSFNHSITQRYQQQQLQQNEDKFDLQQKHQQQQQQQQQKQSNYSTTEDLLSWCQTITKNYSGVMVTNMTTSWRNGLAFGAIIHHYRPDLIDFDSLKPSDIVGNCKKVFDAASKIGIPKLIDPNDMIRLNVPDKLSVMTYLYQLRSYFTGKSLIGGCSSTSTISDSYSSINDEITDTNSNTDDDQKSNKQNNDSIEDVKSKCKTLFKRFDELDLSTINLNDNNNNDDQTTTDKQSTTTTKTKKPLMTRKQLLYPFDSDSDEIEEQEKDEDEEEEIEIMNKPLLTTQNQKHNDNSIVETINKPIRKPLKFSYNKITLLSNKMPTSQSTLLFNNNKNQNNFIEIAPGLIDLSDKNSKNKKQNLQRTFSVPIYEQSKNNNNNNTNNDCIDELLNRKRTPLREEELRERARKLIDSIRIDSKNLLLQQQQQQEQLEKQQQDKNLKSDEERRMEQLRERARRLIANAKQGMIVTETTDTNVSDSSSIVNQSQLINQTESTDQQKNINDDDNKSNVKNNSEQPVKQFEFNFYEFKTCDTPAKNTQQNSTNQQQQLNKKLSPIKLSSKTIVEKNKSNEYNDFPSSIESMQQELIQIDKEQKRIDREASILEKRLRKLMDAGGNPRLEEKLIQNWFILVNKRNAIIRRQMQLNILEKEADMNNRYDELNVELRGLMLIEDFKKTNEQRAREKQLLDELVKIVDKRNELVQHLDNQEKAIEEDEFVENQTQRSLPSIIDNQNAADKNCIIQ